MIHTLPLLICNLPTLKDKAAQTAEKSVQEHRMQKLYAGIGNQSMHSDRQEKIMRMTERDYDAFAEDHFPNMGLVRAWADCKIWSAGVEQALLVLVDNASKRVALFEYDTPAERENHIQLVLHLPDDEDGAGEGIPACISPIPPSRSAQNAQPRPINQSENL